MNLLVTGGAGFIGSNFIYDMLARYPSCNIVCLDLLTYAGNLSTLAAAQSDPRFTFVRGDIAHRDTVYALFEEHRFDAVVNFAAETHVDRSITDPAVFLHTNVLGTQVLLDACRDFQVARFHQISTDEVYGDLSLDRPDLLFTETSPLRPSSPYSASKASADLLALAYHRTYGLPVTVSRCSNNYGPYQFPEKLIPLMVAKALADEPLPLYGTGSNIRDWLYVTDHCRAIDLILQKGQPGEIYNLGGRCERSNLYIVQTILSLLGKPASLIAHVPDRKGHDLRYAIDPSKAEQALAWHPATAFDTGLAATVQWYRTNTQWWKNIEE